MLFRTIWNISISFQVMDFQRLKLGYVSECKHHCFDNMQMIFKWDLMMSSGEVLVMSNYYIIFPGYASLIRPLAISQFNFIIQNSTNGLRILVAMVTWANISVHSNHVAMAIISVAMYGIVSQKQFSGPRDFGKMNHNYNNV